MINKFYINISIVFFLCFGQSLMANDLNINANTVEVEKINKNISAEGNVEITDSKNNIINAEKIKYDKLKQILNTFGETEILTSEQFKIKGKDIVFHLAALISIPFSYKSVDSFVQTNISGSINVFESS